MRIPDEIKLKHYKAVAFLGKNQGDLTYETIQRFLILFYGYEHRKEIMAGDYKSVLELFNRVVLKIDSAIKHKNDKPKKVITLGGKKFLLVNMMKPSIGWMVDASSVDNNTPPYVICALGYTPMDSYYGELDDHKNLLYPSSELRETFENEMLLVDFLRLNAFFLKQSQLLLLQCRTEVRVMKMLRFWRTLPSRIKNWRRKKELIHG